MAPTALARLADLAGTWSGTNRLWLRPDQPERRSETTAAIATAAQGRFVTLRYTWTDLGTPQDGLLVVGFDDDRGAAVVHWLDSWHMSDKVMRLEGAVDAGGDVFVRGSYAAPPGPDWGWTIRIEPAAATFRLVMHNIPPEGEPQLAVEAAFTRDGRFV